MKLITETIENIEVLTEANASGKKDYKIRGVFMQADVKNHCPRSGTERIHRMVRS